MGECVNDGLSYIYRRNMDENYIENLGGSPYIDEGLWDRLRSRAAGYTQAAKNLAFKGTGNVENQRFATLFKKYLTNSLDIITDADGILIRYENARKLTPEQMAEVYKMEALETALKAATQIDLSEAFFRPFKVTAAIASGDVNRIIETYKQQLTDQYATFLNDALKMNVNVQQHLQRLPLEAQTVLKALGDLTGQNLFGPIPQAGTPKPAPTMADLPEPTPIGKTATTTPATTPAAATPTPTPAPTPTASPVLTPATSTPVPTPVASAPASPTPASPVAPATTVSNPPATGTTPAVPTGSAKTEGQIDKNVAFLHLSRQAIDKLLTVIPPKSPKKTSNLDEADNADDSDDAIEKSTSGSLEKIAKYFRRDATKADYKFPRNNPVIMVKLTNGVSIRWTMRWRYSKDIAGHAIDVARYITPKGGKEIPAREWNPFIQYNIADIVDQNTLQPLANFKTLELIKKASPAIAAQIENGLKVEGGQPFLPSDTEKNVQQSLKNIVLVIGREEDRGKKQTANMDMDMPDQAGRGDEEDSDEEPKPEIPPELQKQIEPDQAEKMGGVAPDKTARVNVGSSPESPTGKPTQAEPPKGAAPSGTSAATTSPSKEKEEEKPESSSLAAQVPAHARKAARKGRAKTPKPNAKTAPKTPANPVSPKTPAASPVAPVKKKSRTPKASTPPPPQPAPAPVAQTPPPAVQTGSTAPTPKPKKKLTGDELRNYLQMKQKQELEEGTIKLKDLLPPL